MGGTVNDLGHVNIVPNPSQDEYDYLYGLTEPWMSGSPPKRPGQLDRACRWEPCPHGCCLSWNSHDKFHAGVVWMHYLIDHLLGPGARARTSTGRWFSGLPSPTARTA